MGSAASVNELSSQQFCELLCKFDDSFAEYSSKIIESGVDGTVLSSLTSKDEIQEKFCAIGITDELALAKLNLFLFGSHVNSALIFIKPHANNLNVQNLVSSTLESKGFSIVNQGEVVSDDIDKKQLIDNHYYSIASKATLVDPKDLPVPRDKFESFFQISYEVALEEGSVYNAMQACEYLEVNAKELEMHWRNAKDKTVKFGGGFYCAKFENIEGKKPIYVFNGFFMSMRSDFVLPNTSIHYYIVEWNPNDLGISWSQFRANVLGATDPSKSDPQSLRGLIMSQWEALGLAEPPGGAKNGVHGSASPLEGLAEKCNWLDGALDADPFAKSLKLIGFSTETIMKWCKDATIDGIGSVFDYFEDNNSDQCYLKALALRNK